MLRKKRKVIELLLIYVRKFEKLLFALSNPHILSQNNLYRLCPIVRTHILIGNFRGGLAATIY